MMETDLAVGKAMPEVLDGKSLSESEALAPCGYTPASLKHACSVRIMTSIFLRAAAPCCLCWPLLYMHQAEQARTKQSEAKFSR